MNQWKASIRAWLIDLVREAIRVEIDTDVSVADVSVAPTLGDKYWDAPPDWMRHAAGMKRDVNVQVVSDPSPDNKTPSYSEPSFEQMQSAAIAEQEKYYEVAK